MDAPRTRDRRLCAVAFAVMAGFAVLHAVAAELSWLRRIELAAFDAQMRWRGAKPPGTDTVIVMVDERTIAELGQWPVPRSTFADLVTTLHRSGAKVIGIDVLFADPGPRAATGAMDGDAALAQSIRAAGNVVLPFTFEFGPASAHGGKSSVASAAYAQLRKVGGYRPLALEPTVAVAPLPALAEAASLGHMLAAYDVDGAPRYDYPAFEYDLDFYPSMAVRIVQMFTGVRWDDVRAELGTGISIGRLYIPTDPQMRQLVNYLGPTPAFATYSLSQVVRGAVPDSTFRDRIVLVGANALGTRDTFESPFTSVLPGVERLATVIDSILHEHHLRRPQAALWLEIVSMLVVALVLGVAVSRLPLSFAALCAVALAAGYALSAQIALSRYGVWQMSALPAAAVVGTFIALSLYRYGLLDKERRHMRRIFRRYLAPPMVDRLLANPKLPELGGEQRELTILFCDLRGFTALSEHLDPTVLTRVLNQFLSAATEAILERGGTVDKYVGDAIMAFWNAPLDQPNHAELACRAALRIVQRLDGLNASWAREGNLPTLSAGVGVNTGRCTVGNFGSAHRFDYSAIGDAVNIAARLESETRTRGFAILLGAETCARVRDFATLPLGSARVRGRSGTLEVHALVGDETVASTASFRELRTAHLQSRLAEPGRRADA
jgi:adenylate cyclase